MTSSVKAILRLPLRTSTSPSLHRSYSAIDGFNVKELVREDNSGQPARERCVGHDSDSPQGKGRILHTTMPAGGLIHGYMLCYCAERLTVNLLGVVRSSNQQATAPEFSLNHEAKEPQLSAAIRFTFCI